jgi:patatin-like phospholipase/acyl hydrolase
MVGTSTGGLIALLLGRLKMSGNAAIDAYRDLAKEVLHEETRSWLGRVKPVLSKDRYSAAKLEAAIRRIAGEEKLEDPEFERKCRVAVVEVEIFRAEGLPDLFRTYTTDVPPYECRDIGCIVSIGTGIPEYTSASKARKPLSPTSWRPLGPDVRRCTRK